MKVRDNSGTALQLPTSVLLVVDQIPQSVVDAAVQYAKVGRLPSAFEVRVSSVLGDNRVEVNYEGLEMSVSGIVNSDGELMVTHAQPRAII